MRGRKPLPTEARRNARVDLRVHPNTKAAWEAKAKEAGIILSAWIERTLDRAEK